jgi:ribosomal protein L16 Arg81 hydroxylase
VRIEDVVAPIRFAEFLRSHWDRQPLHIPGAVDKFRLLPGLESLPRMLAGTLTREGWALPSTTHCNAYRVDLDGRRQNIDGVTADSYAKLYNSGFTLCFGDVASSDSKLAELVQSAVELSRFRSKVVVTCYLSPAESSGVVHFDSQHVFFIQRTGTKRWRVSREPGRQHPIRNFMYSSEAGGEMARLRSAGYDIKVPAECGHFDVTLAEGDVLYMPPGHYHVPHTTTDSSFHYTLTLDPLCFWDFVSSSLEATLLGEATSFLGDLRAHDEASLDAALAARLDVLKKRLLDLSLEEMKALLLRSD